jgi:hypothetical protein
METLSPAKREKMKRDKKIMKLFEKWSPLFGRSGAYNKIAATGIASYATVVNTVKANEATQEPEEALNV